MALVTVSSLVESVALVTVSSLVESVALLTVSTLGESVALVTVSPSPTFWDLGLRQYLSGDNPALNESDKRTNEPRPGVQELCEGGGGPGSRP